MKRILSAIKLMYFAFWFMVLFSRNVYAYVDPSIMTYAIQAIAGIAISLGTFFSIYWRKISKSINLKSKKIITETDDLYFNDPESGDTIRAVKTGKQQAEIKNKDEKTEVKKKTGFKEHIERLKPGVFLAFSSSFLLCIFAPLDFYFHSVYDFNFDIYHLFPALFKLFLIILVLILLILLFSYLLYDNFYYAVMFAGFVVYICTYIQGNFLVKDLPVMDGTWIDWSVYGKNRLQTAIVWILVSIIIILIARFLGNRKGVQFLSLASCFISAILAITILVVSFQNDGYVRKNIISTKRNEFMMSDKENFVILVLDMYDSSTFHDIIDNDLGYKEIFNDFNYYPDTVSAYGYTTHAIPQMLTGQWYENSGDFQEFIKESMNNSPLFIKLEEEGFSKDLYEPYLNYDSNYLSRFGNMKEIPFEFNSFKEFSKKMIKLVWFRYAPYSLKYKANIQIEDLNNLRKETEDFEAFSDSNLSFFNDLQNAKIDIVDDKIFKFIHLEGAHMPYRYDENMNVISEADGTYYLQAKAALTVTEKYLQLLKDSQVYDNSNIIILSDHGYQVDLEGEKYFYARSNPILLIKLKDEHHDMTINNSPISYDDLIDAYLRIIDGCNADTVFDAKEGDQRSRRYLGYVGPEGYDEMIECFQTGKAWDIETMIESGIVYSKDN